MTARVTARGLGVEYTYAPGVRVTTRGLMVEWQYARSLLAVQLLASSGLAPVFAPANPAGFAMPNEYGRRVFAVVRNGGAAAIDVTVQMPYLVDGLSVAPRIVTVSAGEERWIGGLKAPFYNRRPDEVVWLDFSAVTNVTIAALRVAEFNQGG